MTKALADVEWNFSKDRIMDSEIIACCYWEYARESEFVRHLRTRSWDLWKPLYQENVKPNDKLKAQIHRDLQRVQSIGYPAEVFLRGISCPPDGVLPDAPKIKAGETHPLTGSFPRPWQELTKEERLYRSYIGSDVERIPIVPFARAITLDAKDIVESVEKRRQQARVESDRIKRANPKLSESHLYQTGQLAFTEILPSVLYASGAERTVVSIQWGCFTDDEIASYFRKWLKANRPKSISPPSGKGKKLNDWRVALNRLGIMRALHNFTFADSRFPSDLKERGEKHCYQARKLALQKFQDLFPFLPKGTTPLSWTTKGNRSCD